MEVKNDSGILLSSDQQNLYELLENRFHLYNVPAYIDNDPIQIPHLFTKKEDIEISAFLTATISWGLRKTIIHNARELMRRMDDSPYDFVVNAEEQDLKTLHTFKHRTFNGNDCVFFVRSLQNICRNHGGLERLFTRGYQIDNTIFSALNYFRSVFLDTSHELRHRKHVSSVADNSAAKRLNMLLRWMVRSDAHGIDFGLWTSIPASALMMPLDVHVGRTGRALGLLSRMQDDWKAVEEITANLRLYDPTDPIKYDYALFGMGLTSDF